MTSHSHAASALSWSDQRFLRHPVFPGRRLLWAAFACLLGAASGPATFAAGAEHWSQWRGPSATGASPSANPPLVWSEKENVKWKVELPGSGSGTPVVWGDKIFVKTAIPTGEKVETPTAGADAPPPGQRRFGPGGRGGRGGRGFGATPPDEVYQFVLLCLDRQTGSEMWRRVAAEEVPHEGHHQDHGFASHSAVTDGEHVLAYFGSRGLYCYDLEGDLKWEKRFGRMRTSLGFGEGSSPALFGDTVVVNWDHEGDSFIVALNKVTGEELWRQARPERTTWATPHIVQPEGGRPQVVVPATGQVRSYDLKTGEVVWTGPGLTANVIPSPVSGDGLVYLTSGFRGNALHAIRVGRTGDLSGTDAMAWSHDRNTPYVPSPLLYRGRLYILSGNTGLLSSFDAATGQQLYSERLEGLLGVYASPVGANGRVYVAGRNGVTAVLKDSSEFEVLATNRLEEAFDASPVPVGRDLLLRGREYLYCIAEN